LFEFDKAFLQSLYVHAIRGVLYFTINGEDAHVCLWCNDHACCTKKSCNRIKIELQLRPEVIIYNKAIQKGRDIMHNAKIIFILVLLALVAVFTFQNTAVVEIKLLLWSVSMSASLMLLTALFSGVIIGLLLSFMNARRKAKKENDMQSFQS